MSACVLASNHHVSAKIGKPKSTRTESSYETYQNQVVRQQRQLEDSEKWPQEVYAGLNGTATHNNGLRCLLSPMSRGLISIMDDDPKRMAQNAIPEDKDATQTGDHNRTNAKPTCSRGLSSCRR
jgi:hypothetical protein